MLLKFKLEKCIYMEVIFIKKMSRILGLEYLKMVFIMEFRIFRVELFKKVQKDKNF